MESIREFLSEAYTGELKRRRLGYAAVFAASFCVGLIRLTLFEAKLAPFALAAALALLITDREPKLALLGALGGALVTGSVPTMAFCCFAAPPMLIPWFRKSPPRVRFCTAAALMLIPCAILGGSFVGIASYMLGECIMLMCALAVCLGIMNLSPERRKVTVGRAGSGDRETAKKPAAAVSIEQLSVRARALAEVLYEVSQKSSDALMGRQLCCIANRLDRLTAVEPKRSKRFEVRIGTALIPKRFNDVTGDSCIVSPNGTKVLVALSDGMGSGHAAERESMRTLELVKKLIGVGFSLSEAADCVNMLMLGKGGGEMYATLDAALIDLSTGRAQLLKSGASPSWLIRGGDVRTLYSEALPIGIIRDIAPAVLEPELRRGDVLVMMTDGVADALGMELIAAIHELVMTFDEPEAAANSLLEAAKRRSGADDMSVAVIRVES